MLLMGREKTQFFIGFSNKAFSSYLCWKIEKLQSGDGEKKIQINL